MSIAEQFEAQRRLEEHYVNVLMVGGPADGLLMRIREDAECINYPIPITGKVPLIENGNITKSGITQVHYDIKKIKGQWTTFRIGYSGGSFDHWFDKLLRGYNPKETK